MKIHLKSALASLSALAIAGGITIATAGTAFAVTPGWEPDPNVIGTVTFTDATGAPITGGSTTASPMAAFAVAAHVGRSFDTKAFMDLCTPQSGVNSQLWNCDQLGASTAYSSALTPADVYSPGLPVQLGTAGDESVATENTNFPNLLTTATYQNLYQVRIYTAGPGHTADLTQFDATDILVNPATSTWTVAYPGSTISTTTTLTSTPAGPTDVTSTNPVPVTLNASVSAGTAVPSTYTGPIGTVSFFGGTTGTTLLGTQLVTGTASPYTASFATSVANPSVTSFKAVFSPYVGTTLLGSPSSAVPLSVAPPAPATDTSLAVTPGTYAGDQNSYQSFVTLHGTTTPGCTGTVTFYDNLTTIVAGPVTPKPGTPNEYDATNTFSSPGNHSITAVFTPTVATDCATSTSGASAFSQASNPNGPCAATGAQCTDVQNIEADIPQGVLYINTPYGAGNPLNLHTLALDSTGTMFTANTTFGGGTADPHTDIFITDSRAGDLPWTAQAQASNLTAGTSTDISGENVGLTNLTVVPVPGNGFNGLSSNFSTVANPAASPAVGPADTGTQGLGKVAHTFAQAHQGIGSIALYGTLTLNAPSSTVAGHYTGTITFTIVGSFI